MKVVVKNASRRLRNTSAKPPSIDTRKLIDALGGRPQGPRHDHQSAVDLYVAGLARNAKTLTIQLADGDLEQLLGMRASLDGEKVKVELADIVKQVVHTALSDPKLIEASKRQLRMNSAA